MSTLILGFWRHLLLAFMVTWPVLALAVLGLLWLMESGWLWIGLLLMAGSSLVSWLLVVSIRAQRLSAAAPAAESRWSPKEEHAWRRVCEVAAQAEKSPPSDADGLHRFADMVVHEVAENLQGKSEFAWASFTLPELLGALEDAAARTRQHVSQRVPGASQLQAAHLLKLYGMYDRHRGVFRAGYTAYRILRAIKNPANAIAAEAKGFLQDRATTSTGSFLKGVLARSAVEELGRVAINLYGGRYRLPAAEAGQRLVEAAPAPTRAVPIRILLAGQVNAGKSSLTNALLDTIKAPVSALPTPGGLREFRVQKNDQLDMTIMDSAGLDGGQDRLAELQKSYAQADLILWVVQANNPARDNDAVALRALRQQMDANPHLRAPRILLVMTHIDRLRPVREWAPPYDLLEANSTKAENIRESLQCVADALELKDAPMIPVSLREGENPYNLDALWSAIGTHLDDSQLVALDREIKQNVGISVQALAQQAYQGGRYLLGKSWQSMTGARETLNS